VERAGGVRANRGFRRHVHAGGRPRTGGAGRGGELEHEEPERPETTGRRSFHSRRNGRGRHGPAIAGHDREQCADGGKGDEFATGADVGHRTASRSGVEESFGREVVANRAPSTDASNTEKADVARRRARPPIHTSEAATPWWRPPGERRFRSAAAIIASTTGAGSNRTGS